MDNGKYKKHILIFLALSVSLLLVCMLTVVVIDPFFQYHGPLPGVGYVIDNQLSQNPGIARRFEYDSVILGSSMTINFDTELFAQTMGLNTIKLSYNGAYPRDIDNIMTIVKERKTWPKEIFLGIDIPTYKAEPGITAYEIPEYLYDTSPWNDLPYLLNKDVFLDYISHVFRRQPGTPLNEIYSTWGQVFCGRQNVLSSYALPRESETPLPADAYIGNIEANLNAYIIPYIESMPDTHFTVFFPPYSILYWYTQSAEGGLEAELAGERYIMERLLSYHNVSVFYFQNMYDFITDLDNYSDYTHYGREMNDYMTRCFQDGSHRLTVENYAEVLDRMLLWMEENLDSAALQAGVGEL